MTIIAYRKGILAADTLISEPDNHLKSGYAKKIVKTKDGYLAGANGDCEYCVKFLEWAQTDRKTNAPKCCDDSDGAFLITPKGKIHYYYGKVFEVLDNEYVAIGSGAPVALGAMFAGGSAVVAVEAACKWNTLCDGKITILTLNKYRN